MAEKKEGLRGWLGLGSGRAARVEKALLPLLDMFNHHSAATSQYRYDQRSDRFIVKAGSAYRPGEEVMVSYGDKGNDELLQLFGFVEPNNPHDVYQAQALLAWAGQTRGEEGWEARLGEVRAKGVWGEEELGREGATPALLQAMCELIWGGGPDFSLKQQLEALEAVAAWAKQEQARFEGGDETIEGGGEDDKAVAEREWMAGELKRGKAALLQGLAERARKDLGRSRRAGGLLLSA